MTIQSDSQARSIIQFTEKKCPRNELIWAVEESIGITGRLIYLSKLN